MELRSLRDESLALAARAREQRARLESSGAMRNAFLCIGDVCLQRRPGGAGISACEVRESAGGGRKAGGAVPAAAAPEARCADFIGALSPCPRGALFNAETRSCLREGDRCVSARTGRALSSAASGRTLLADAHSLCTVDSPSECADPLTSPFEGGCSVPGKWCGHDAGTGRVRRLSALSPSQSGPASPLFCGLSECIDPRAVLLEGRCALAGERCGADAVSGRLMRLVPVSERSRRFIRASVDLVDPSLPPIGPPGEDGLFTTTGRFHNSWPHHSRGGDPASVVSWLTVVFSGRMLVNTRDAAKIDAALSPGGGVEANVVSAGGREFAVGGLLRQWSDKGYGASRWAISEAPRAPPAVLDGSGAGGAGGKLVCAEVEECADPVATLSADGMCSGRPSEQIRCPPGFSRASDSSCTMSRGVGGEGGGSTTVEGMDPSHRIRASYAFVKDRQYREGDYSVSGPGISGGSGRVPDSHSVQGGWATGGSSYTYSWRNNDGRGTFTWVVER